MLSALSARGNRRLQQVDYQKLVMRILKRVKSAGLHFSILVEKSNISFRFDEGIWCVSSISGDTSWSMGEFTLQTYHLSGARI